MDCDSDANDRYLYMDIVMAAVILSNIKLSGFFYVGMFLGTYWISVLIRKQYIKAFRLFIAGICVFLCCILTGINPYGTNIVNGNHIFHPLMGTQKIDIMTPMRPSVIRTEIQIKRVFVSMFSRSSIT